MTQSIQVRRRMRRGAYALPSLFTMGNILLGFWAIVRGYQGDFYTAAWLILGAGVLDGLDGRIARLTHTESEFGRELDSLADVITFGVVPALLAFFWGLHELERIGWLVPLYYLLCTAVRLARFNVQTKSADSRYFVGLPSPAAAGTLAALLILTHQLEGHRLESLLMGTMVGALLGLGTLMISTFRYPSLKKLDLRRRFSYRTAIGMAAILLLLTYRPAVFLQCAAVGFTLAGPLGWLFGRLRRRPKGSLEGPASPDGEL
ncbi:MAG: CDP-diacylglycerol--serine O-phosphatidyltransferase [Acidobacteriota bacterium]